MHDLQKNLLVSELTEHTGSIWLMQWKTHKIYFGDVDSYQPYSMSAKLQKKKHQACLG